MFWVGWVLFFPPRQTGHDLQTSLGNASRRRDEGREPARPGEQQQQEESSQDSFPQHAAASSLGARRWHPLKSGAKPSAEPAEPQPRPDMPSPAIRREDSPTQLAWLGATGRESIGMPTRRLTALSKRLPTSSAVPPEPVL